MIRLDGRTVLITGGSRGIGRAAALMFAQAGADVAISYVSNKKAADEVCQAVEKLGRRALAYKAEMGSRADIDRMVADILARWGELDTLVNNAGIWTYLEMGRMDAAVYHETVAVNIDGVFYGINAVVPSMKEHGRGSIINVTSTAGVRGEAFHSHYAASKGALHSLTKSLAVELAPYRDPGQRRGARLGGHRHERAQLQRPRVQGEGPPDHPPAAHPAGRGHRRSHPVPGLRPGPARHRRDPGRQRRVGAMRRIALRD